MKQKKTIALVTGSHLSSNPRLVKEASALQQAGYKVKILCAQNLSMLCSFDEEIFRTLKDIEIRVIQWHNKSFHQQWLRVLSSVRLKLAYGLEKMGIANSHAQSLLLSRILPEIKAELKAINADLYIAHTLAALPAVAWAAKYHKSKYGFDAEDYHREENFPADKITTSRVKAIEDDYLPSTNYITAASPFIAKKYKELYPSFQPLTINNVFPLSTPVKSPSKATGKLKLVWFSQTIGLNRGIQSVIEALNQLNDPLIELHLRGTSSNEVKHILEDLASKSLKKNISFYPQCSPSDLEAWLPLFDIGLALEPGFSPNNNLAISNKIFQYMTAGLAIIATDTQGQRWVMEQAAHTGKLVPVNDANAISISILKWKANRTSLENAKKESLQLVKAKFNWEIEQKQFLALVSRVLND